MATKPSVALAAIGQKISATLWNNGVYRLAQFVDVTKPVCFLTTTAAQAVATATFTAITFDTEVVDSDNQHSTSTNTSRVVIGTTLGYYRVSGMISWSGSAAGATPSRRGDIALNGAAVSGSQSSIPVANAAFAVSIIPPIIVQSTVSTDYVEIRGWQDTGGSLNTAVSGSLRPSFLVEYVGTLQ